MSEEPISAEVSFVPGQSRLAAQSLQRLGFRVLHIGPTISVQGPQELWRRVFNVDFVGAIRERRPGVPGTEMTYSRAILTDFRIPTDLEGFLTDVAFQEPPEFF